MTRLLAVAALLTAVPPSFFQVRGDQPLDSPPKWSTVYSARGIISIPYAELSEPFFAYYDGTIGASRIDYYGDTVKTFQISTLGRYGAMRKVVPMTTEHEMNVQTCLEVNGTVDNKVTPQTVLPDLTGYQYIGKDVINGIEAEKWTYEEQIGEKVSSYIMWLTRQKTNKLFKTQKEDPVPIRFEMKGYNSLLGSHYDHYYLSYDLYNSEKPSADVWELNPNITCTSFPGPGHTSVAQLNPMKEFIHNYDGHIEEEWRHFKKSYGKKYKNKSEHEERRRVFRDNHRFVHSSNRASRGYHLKLNHYADWTADELKVLRGRRHSTTNNGASPFPYTKAHCNAIPDDFNWRLYGGVTPVKDQSICGSCWSFGTTGAIEGAYFVKTGLLISLSEQALIDCSWGYGNNGCDGGEDFRSYQWMLKHGGLPLEGDYGSYLGQDGYCHADQVKMVAPITGYVNVTTNDEDALRLAIFKHGPISIAIDASQRTFTFYSHGVYSDPNCKSGLEDLDHAVLAVGYGQLNGKRYWLVKNSWSNMWGNDGYILIGSTNNICGVMTSPTYVTM